MENNLPTYEQIVKWDDDKLKSVHRLLFDQNVNPGGMGEEQSDVDDYMYEVHLVYEQQFNNQ